MLAYVVRRLLYGVGVVLGVLMVLFILFFTIASPDDLARRALGEKARQSAIDQWKANHGYDRPLWPSLSAEGLTDNLLFDHYRRMLSFDFGHSDVDGVPIGERLARGAPASLALMLPLFLIETTLAIGIGLFVAVFRGTYIDHAGVFACVLLMSQPILLQIIGAQYLIAKLLSWFPLSGFAWGQAPGHVKRISSLESGARAGRGKQTAPAQTERKGSNMKTMRIGGVRLSAQILALGQTTAHRDRCAHPESNPTPAMKNLRLLFLVLAHLLSCLGTTGCFTFGPFLGG